ncbi:DUF192 domain-containing protein [Coleofasciculus sp.]|uniref:DUF192 domain-containing protein n=1 Tax=Coleofasciculus sp. TaxID=3100458 RepID=UPI0039F77091
MKYPIRLFGITLSLILLGCSASGSKNVADGTPLKSGERLPEPPSLSSSPPNSGQMLPISAQTQIGDQQILLEVARTPGQQQIGLMYRTALAPNRGMLFPLNPPRPATFWMKNVKIPLDMIFLRDGEVKAIAANVPPCITTPCPTYGPGVLVDQVIELAGGRAAQLGLKVGDRITITILEDEINPSPES